MMADERVSPLARAARKRILDALPKNNLVHWTPATKALVVQAVEGGWLQLDEALVRYRMGLEEYRSWQDALRPGDPDRSGERQSDILRLAEARARARAQARRRCSGAGKPRTTLRVIHGHQAGKSEGT
jgi:hypothetical protein